MQLTLNISNKQLFDKIMWLLSHFKNDGLEIIVDKQEDDNKKGLDFSSFKIESFKEIDGLEYQEKIRNEW